ncbi:hypothetical protein [Nostoc sp. TCL26-01]|uniref:hypothetical protein n=1 Tax=Nostoc sp. TCL26-01 TaxID=2576904 RepID=UPI0015B99520|nr:hypothetical protein [Nostoc sp. TCL26-01]QLE55935.1 hypothetical protein FD725_10610 [Nostoc sp. TCL26-01]
MTNSNGQENYNQEVKKESYVDANGNTHTRLTQNTETPSNSYQKGYVNGRNHEYSYQRANLAERDNENAANGLILGILLTSLVGLIAGAFWYFNQNNAPVDSTAPVETPLPASATPSISPQPQQTTIIERTREVPVVIPQQQVPPTTVPSPPQINVTVPPQQSTREVTPAVTPKTPQVQQSSKPTTENSNTSTSTKTPASSTQASPSPTPAITDNPEN